MSLNFRLNGCGWRMSLVWRIRNRHGLSPFKVVEEGGRVAGGECKQQPLYKSMSFFFQDFLPNEVK